MHISSIFMGFHRIFFKGLQSSWVVMEISPFQTRDIMGLNGDFMGFPAI